MTRHSGRSGGRGMGAIRDRYSGEGRLFERQCYNWVTEEGLIVGWGGDKVKGKG
jgi:hypothetical protein